MVLFQIDSFVPLIEIARFSSANLYFLVLVLPFFFSFFFIICKISAKLTDLRTQTSIIRQMTRIDVDPTIYVTFLRVSRNFQHKSIKQFTKEDAHEAFLFPQYIAKPCVFTGQFHR